MNRTWLIVFGDLISFWVSFFIILDLRFGGLLNSNTAQTHTLPFIILYISWVLTFFLFGLYDLLNIKPTLPHIKRFGLALLICFIVGALFFYLIPIFGIAPKTNLLFQILGFGIISFVLRRIVYILFSKQITRPVIIVGKTKYAEELYNTITTNPQLGLVIISYTPNLHEALEKYSETQNAVFIFESIEQEIPKKDIVKLYENKTEIIDVAEAYERYLVKIPVGYISQSWIVKNINTKKDLLYDVISRIISIIIAITILVLTSPFLIISAICIYLYDHKQIFYSQERVGLNGKIFKLHKLRSMIIESEKDGAMWSHTNDSRITPIGKIIRKLHIDEIPQMINIIKGDITLVGPRPERPEFVTPLEQSIPHYELRHIIRPGFTGWAQIKYRYANTIESSKEKFEYDLYYIKNRNIFLDFGIILKTIQIIFTH
ncbi:MAG: exopolysaccharide biosynthesis polyprenyl glycosylphosphotransferase [Candidatus Nomurabacteria bacterium]|nr:exopolysaccharide biosynthesis polyprenyl glycosylphosphotransferase [Candidatus Nomurabacteria bacterium]